MDKPTDTRQAALQPLQGDHPAKDDSFTPQTGDRWTWAGNYAINLSAWKRWYDAHGGS